MSATYQEQDSALLNRVRPTRTLPAIPPGIASSDRTEDAPVTVDRALPGSPAEVWWRAGDAFARWTDGDAVALDELVAVMTPVLWHVVRAHRLPVELAEDVVQTTWLALVRRRDAIDDPAAVGAWLTTSARREAWRAAKASGRAVPLADEDLGPRVDAHPEARVDAAAGEARRATESAETAAVRAEDRARLWSAVGRLTERCQRLLRIVAFEHRPDYARISADLEMPVGSIGPTRGRCLDKLRALLAEEDLDG